MGYTSRAERTEWLAVCRLPTVDYCDSHLYAETTDRVTSKARLEQYIDDRVQLAGIQERAVDVRRTGQSETRAVEDGGRRLPLRETVGRHEVNVDLGAVG